MRLSLRYRLAGVLLKVYAHVPSGIVGAIEYFTAYFLRRVVRYRLDVVRGNLRLCFPEKDETQRLSIERSYYRHLSYLLLSGLRLSYLAPSRIKSHFSFEGLDVLRYLRDAGHRSIVLVMGHCDNWELFTAAPHYLREEGFSNVNVYKRLEDQHADLFMRGLRSRHGAENVEMTEVGRLLISRARGKAPNETAIVTFISDQCPFREAARYATLFFGHPTAFITGWERLARKLHLPVVYLDVERKGKRHEVGTFKLICENASTEPLFSVVETFAQMLEATIRRHPERWLWSHKRWRVTPNEVPDIAMSPACAKALLKEK